MAVPRWISLPDPLLQITQEKEALRSWKSMVRTIYGERIKVQEGGKTHLQLPSWNGGRQKRLEWRRGHVLSPATCGLFVDFLWFRFQSSYSEMTGRKTLQRFSFFFDSFPYFLPCQIVSRQLKNDIWRESERKERELKEIRLRNGRLSLNTH